MKKIIYFSMTACIGAGSLVSTPVAARPSDTVIATVTLTGSVHQQGIVMSPKGDVVYVSCESGQIYGIDTATNTISFSYQAANALEGMDISPDGQSLYVVELATPPAPQTLVQFSTATLQPIDSVSMVEGFYDIPAVNPDGSLIYVPGSGADGTVAVFSTNPFSGTGSLGSWQNPHQAVFTPDGAHAYITVLGVQPQAGFLNYANVATGTWTNITGPKRGPRFNQPWGLTISPNGGTVYVTQSDSFNSKGVEQKGVVLVDTASNMISSWISVVAPGANAPNYSSFAGMPAITPDGKYLYVPIPFIEYTDPTTGTTSTSDAQTVAVINIARRKVIDEITVEYEPSRIAISPGGTRAYVLDQNNWSTVSVIDITGS